LARPLLPVIAGLFLSIVTSSAGFAQAAGIRTYANPLDIDYKYNFEQLNQGVSYRSGADPVVVSHKGEYFLFVTVSGGYWHSSDLIRWRFVTPTRWPFEDNVAPAAISERDTLFLMQSAMMPRPILYSTDPVDHESNIFASDSTVYTQFRLHHSTDGKRWKKIADLTRERRDRPNAYIELPRPVRTRFIRYEHIYVGSPNLAIGDLRVFGNRSGRPPATPKRLAARRDTDSRNAFVTWSPVRGVVGYNILWGIQPDKLYQTYQVFADAKPRLELRALNVGQEYYVAIEAFDEVGVSPASKPVRVR
jgi:hypothetical protein